MAQVDEQFQVFVDELSDRSAAQRVAGCVALGAYGVVEAVEMLIAKLHDQEDVVRIAACEALGRIADLRGVNPLLEAVTHLHSSDEVARAAGLGLDAIWRVTKPRLKRLLCADHLVPFERQSVESWSGDFSYPGCPVCGSGSSAVEGLTIVAALDATMTAHHFQTNEQLVVNWLDHGELFDFDRVEIRQADDDQATRFAALIRSDYEMLKRCRALTCRVTSQCLLSPNTINVLADSFGTVEIETAVE